MSETQLDHTLRLRPSRARQIALAIVLNMIAAQFAIAQEHRGSHGVGHFKLHHWYKTLRQPGTGYECCDQKDCRATTARAHGPHIEVLVDGEWTRVPPNTILQVQSP